MSASPRTGAVRGPWTDLGTDPGTGPVTARVLSARRGIAWLCAAESALLGAAALAATLAAAAASGADLALPEARAAALLAGACAAAAWWIERRPDAPSVARALDREVGADGALETAFESEASARGEGIPRLLSARVAPLARPARLLRPAARSTAALLAAPLAAAALLAFAFEAQREGREAAAAAEETRLSARADLVLSRVARLRRSSALPPEEARDMAAIEAEARLSADRTGSAAERSAALETLAGRLADLERREAASGVASGAADGTMSGPGAVAGGAPSPPVDAPGPPSFEPGAAPSTGDEAGVSAGRWWPQRYDEVVRRWIEARRADREGRNR